MVHPAMKRSWLQTGGPEVEPVHKAMRAEFDQAHHVQYIGAGCFKLFDQAGDQVGIVQFQGALQASADTAMEAVILQEATGVAPPPNTAAGDTVIRSLDMRDPVDAELAGKALAGDTPRFVVSDLERQDPPPIDMPDYEADRFGVWTDADEEVATNGHRFPLWMYLVAIFVLAAAAMAGGFAATYLGDC